MAVETREPTYEQQVTTLKRVIDMVRDAALLAIDDDLMLAADTIAGPLFTLRKQLEVFSAGLEQSDRDSDQRSTPRIPGEKTRRAQSAGAVNLDRSAPAPRITYLDIHCWHCRAEYSPTSFPDALRFFNEHLHS